MKDSAAMSGSGGVSGAAAGDLGGAGGGSNTFSSPVDVMVVSRFDYKATDAHELSIRKNEKLRLLDDTQHWWRVMNSQGQCGYVPSNYVKKSKQGLFSSLRNTLGRRKKRDPVPSATGTGGSGTGTGGSAGFRGSRGNSPASATSTGHRPSSPNPSGNLSYPRGSSIVVQSPPGQSGGPGPSSTGYLASPLGMSTPGGHGREMPGSGGASDLGVYNNGSTSAAGLRLPSASIQDDSLQICVAKFNYTACQPDELSLAKGERIEVFEKSTDGWWRGRKAGQDNAPLGWFPSNYVVQQQATSQAQPTSTAPAGGNLYVSQGANMSRTAATGSSASTGADSSSCDYNNCSGGPSGPNGGHVHHQSALFTVLTLYPFNKNHPEELDFAADEVLQIVEKPANDPDWWRARNARGDMGLVPRNYVRIISSSTGAGGSSGGVAQGVPLGTGGLGASGSGGSRGSTMRSGAGGVIAVPPGFMGAPGAHQTGEEIRRGYNPKGLYPDKEWYWGILSRIDCEAMLSQNARIGQFAVRDSETHPGDLTITMFTGTKNRNFKVRLEGGQYCIGQKVFDTLEDLIQHYRTHPIYKSEHEKHYLTQPFKHPGLTCS